MAVRDREQWGSRVGFLLAAVGSAVGLGNMWRFPYFAAENGGAAFVFLYIVMTALVGLPVMLAEFAVGRGARKSPVEALTYFGGRRWRPLGYLFVASGFLILAYYSVIAGWTVRYAVDSILWGFPGETGAWFQEVATGWTAVLWHLAFMGLTLFVVARGIKGGIERAALVLMPLLFLVVCGLALYAATLKGAGEGYRFYLQPRFDEILSLEVLAGAAGQAFFSLSLGMGAMLTFSSYLTDDHNLPNESLVIAGSDFFIAFVAGLTVFPLIFAFSLQGEVGESTVGALFITLPKAFGAMGAAGRAVGILFFAALVVGALTSAISLLEVVTSSAMDTLGWSRGKAAGALGGAIALLGIPPALNLTVLDVMDKVAGNVFLVVGALGLSVFVGWVMNDPVAEVRKGAERVRWFFLWRGLLRWLVPAVLVIVLWQTLGDAAETLGSLFR